MSAARGLSEETVLATLQRARVLPVVALDDASVVPDLCAALLAGGISTVEITFRTAAAAAALERASEVEGMVVGAGTVLTVEQARAAAEAGAAFAVAPGTDDEIVAACGELGLPFFPGIATPSELGHALRLGCATVKVFPVSTLGGPAFLRAVSATFPQARFLPTGGIDAGSLASYLAVPAVVACGGSWICDARSIRERDFAGIEHRARAAMDGDRMTWPLELRPRDECRYDLVALGEVMLRLDPGEGRIATTRSFRVWEGGGEYNVARGLRRCFGLRTGIVTALADNPVGRLIEDLMLQGGVEQAELVWRAYDGIGLEVRNGLNFTERGFGVRGAVGCSDRANTAASQLRPGDVDWERIFGDDGARWLHTGGVFCALSETTPAVALEAVSAARRHGVVVSYDLNYRPSLWRSRGGADAAAEVNREIVRHVDVLFGNEEDFAMALGYPLEEADENLLELDVGNYERLLGRVLEDQPQVALVASTLRRARTATLNDWSAVCRTRDGFPVGPSFEALEILDRVGGGDSFASGLIYGLLEQHDVDTALAYGVAHGALAMTTPGDTSMATRAEVERLVGGRAPRVDR